MLVRAVLVAVTVCVVTAATPVLSPTTAVAPPVIAAQRVVGTVIPGFHAAAQLDSADVVAIGAADVRAAAAGAMAWARRIASSDPRPDTFTKPDGAGRVVPSAANLGPPPPAIKSRARATITSLAPARPTAPAPAAVPTPRSARPATASTAYRGRNHVWIPSLGISRSVQWFPCTRSRPPDAGVYRWGCSGRNNVYLMSHAWSAFKPLHDAYENGRLRKGMKVWYADGASRVRQFSVIWWKVTLPTPDASWAWAPQPRPSMTLQTCVGARGQYRLMVRLVQAG